MGYWDADDRSLGWDLWGCLEFNPQGNDLDIDHVKSVLAVVDGQNDGENWHWILELKDGRFAYLEGGCDYTGWDCRSWATSYIESTVAVALDHEEDHSVYRQLTRQLLAGKKDPNWRDEVGKDMPDVPMI